MAPHTERPPKVIRAHPRRNDAKCSFFRVRNRFRRHRWRTGFELLRVCTFVRYRASAASRLSLFAVSVCRCADVSASLRRNENPVSLLIENDVFDDSCKWRVERYAGVRSGFPVVACIFSGRRVASASPTFTYSRIHVCAFSVSE